MLHICKYVLDVDKGYVIHMLPLDEIIVPLTIFFAYWVHFQSWIACDNVFSSPFGTPEFGKA